MEYKIKPWGHQLDAIHRADPMDFFALFFEMGAGKSGTAINIYRHKVAKQRRMLRAIVLAPPIVVPNWKREFAMHSKIPEDMIVLLTGPGEKRLKTFREAAYGKDGKPSACIFVTNYESLLLGSGRSKDAKKSFLPGPLFLEFQRWAPEFLIFDESHQLKNHKAQRSKLADVLANPRGGRKPYTYILSGSPVLNSPMDIFHQFKIMDGGATFGANFFVFRARFFEDKNAGMPTQRYFPNWQVKPGATDEINRLIFQAGMRVTKEECLDLPEEVAVTLPCKMTPKQEKNYREMKRDFVTYVEDKAAVANLAIVKALRLLQITSGFLPLDCQGEETDRAKEVYEKTPKEEALRSLLEELTPHSKVIVWAVWRENYASIRKVCDELGIKYIEVHGDVSAAKKAGADIRFAEDPNIRVWLGHPGSGGIGINLVCAPYSIFYSRTMKLADYLQSRARNHRGGQTSKVTHFDLVCEQTIDEACCEKLASKLDMSESLLKNIALEMKKQAY